MSDTPWKERLSSFQKRKRLSLTEGQKKSVEGYAAARPYVSRGLKFALPATLLTSIMSGKPRTRAAIAAASFGAGVADKKLENASKKYQELSTVRKAYDKTAAMDTSNDPESGAMHRPPEGVFSSGVEQRAVDCHQGVIEGLFANKAEMGRRAHSQLQDLFVNKGEGRHYRLGTSAASASKTIKG